MMNGGIVALGLLTAEDVRLLGENFTRIYPVDETPCWGELLRAIDDADRAIRHARDRTPAPLRSTELDDHR